MLDDVLKKISWSGYTLSTDVFQELSKRLSFYLAVARDRKAAFFFWVSIMGGTGTGKSTVFNSLCRANLSLTGVERPKTQGPVAAFPKGRAVMDLHCFSTVDARFGTTLPINGSPGALTITEHSAPYPWVFVDSPDIDSLAKAHHRMAEDIFQLSDFVIFVVSQEKYADERLNRFLRRVVEERKKFLIVVNKATDELSPYDVLQIFQSQGLNIGERDLIVLPFTRPLNGQLRHTMEWNELESRLEVEAGDERWKIIRSQETQRFYEKLRDACNELLSAVKQEGKALQELIREVKDLSERAIYEVLQQHISTVRDHTRTHLQPQIKALYSRYDVLGKPRRAVGQALSKILEIFGVKITDDKDDSKESTLRKIEEQIDHSPVFHAIDFLVTEVLRRVSAEKKPLAELLRSPEAILSREEVHDLMLNHSKELFGWLEKEFQRMMQGIPKTKELGIYSSFALWGVFILGIEAAMGGGITPIRAAVDAVIAPFITKATVEFFASHEIYRIVEELSERYRQGIESIIFRQRDRFIACIRSFVPEEAVVKSLENVCQNYRT